jgi:hypothetical protein
MVSIQASAPGLACGPAAERGDLDREIALLYRKPGPCRRDQFVFRHNGALTLDEHAEQRDGAPPDRHRLAAPIENGRIEIQPERSDREGRSLAAFVRNWRGR